MFQMPESDKAAMAKRAAYNAKKDVITFLTTIVLVEVGKLPSWKDKANMFFLGVRAATYFGSKSFLV